MSSVGFQLEREFCRQRQQRLARGLQAERCDYAWLCQPEHVQYFTGFRPHPLMQAAVLISAEGKTVLAAPNAIPADHAADEVVLFEAQWNCTLRQDQGAALVQVMQQSGMFPAPGARIGGEGGAAVLGLKAHGVLMDRWQSLDRLLWKLRRRKDPDELQMIRHAIAGTEVMYQRAREVIEPGISELHVYNELQAAVVHFFGEPCTALGNDFQCGTPGGPPRARLAEAGELYILDLGPAYRGYFADNCRTFAVNRQPTEAQMQAWEAIVAVLQWVEATVKPGVSASQLFKEAKRRLDETIPAGFFHHLGHGIGLYAHETPHMNDRWDDQFQEGDVFTAEPGLYAPELCGGIRLEENYLVTATGVERLTSFPLDL